MESDNGPTDSTADTDSERAAPGEARIDVTPALHTAGHEVEDLGFGGVPDSAPILHDDDTDEEDFEHHLETDIATRGQGHV
jgi:hypothetical protein